MKSIAVFVLALLLLFAGCVETSAGEKTSAGQTEQTGQQKTPKVDLGISNSDLKIDDPGLDPATDNFEGLGNP